MNAHSANKTFSFPASDSEFSPMTKMGDISNMSHISPDPRHGGSGLGTPINAENSFVLENIV